MIVIVSALALFLLFALNGVVLLGLDALLTHPPYVPVPQAILPAIVEALALKPGQRLYDLGCGDARVLVASARAAPGIEAVGVEKNLYPYWLARWAARKAPARNVRIIRGDMYKADLRAADRLFLYLYPDVMDKLLPKLSAELRPGSRVVSCDFAFGKKAPMKTIDLGWRGPVTGRRLYIYEF